MFNFMKKKKANRIEWMLINEFTGHVAGIYKTLSKAEEKMFTLMYNDYKIVEIKR